MTSEEAQAVRNLVRLLKQKKQAEQALLEAPQSVIDNAVAMGLIDENGNPL